jgi:glycosyltransferase involved in cell wall biosynthesis
MNITVILCTYNRCQSLATALESVAASTLSASNDWEVLVVDNNSRDNTRGTIEDFCRRYPGRFRYVFEPRPGKSNALNSGIKEARGQILAFTDDDVVVDPNWLQNLTSAMKDGEWIGVAGRIVPLNAFSPPRWLPLEGQYNIRGMLALFDLGDLPCDCDQPPFGANMAFRRTAFQKHGGFRTDLGPMPGSEIRGEDTEFGHRLMASGERLRYAPSAVVHHHIPENRLKKAYFLAFWFDHGRAAIRLIGDRPNVLGIPRDYIAVLRMAALLVERTFRWLVTLNPQRRFYRQGVVWMTAGKITEIYRQLFGKNVHKVTAIQNKNTNC